MSHYDEIEIDDMELCEIHISTSPCEVQSGPGANPASLGTIWPQGQIKSEQKTIWAYTYPCPCGDKFIITEDELYQGETIARCPSCSLYIKVIYDPEQFSE
jgi:DNA-directed RNA polymerase subunit RPC12/RpoP